MRIGVSVTLEHLVRVTSYRLKGIPSSLYLMIDELITGDGINNTKTDSNLFLLCLLEYIIILPFLFHLPLLILCQYSFYQQKDLQIMLKHSIFSFEKSFQYFKCKMKCWKLDRLQQSFPRESEGERLEKTNPRNF